MSSMLRKIQRNNIKYEQKNNKIKSAWRKKQVDKYGLQRYIDLHNKNCKDKINIKSIF